MCSAYYREHHLWLPSEDCDGCIEDYVTTKVTGRDWQFKPCCAERLRFDKRTPGLFKLEFQGEKVLSLCSKLYICVNEGECKMARKGVNG